MPLKKCYSSPHLSQLVQAAEKESPRRASTIVKPEAKHLVPKKVSPKPNSFPGGKGALKKCFSSPHLKDLNNLEYDHSTSSQSRSNDGNVYRNEVINCRFRSCGCTVRLSRERMDSHLRTNAATHSLLILNKIDALTRQNEQICKRLKSMEDSMSSMAQLFENLQEVLASKGIPSRDSFEKPMFDVQSDQDLYRMPPRGTSEPTPRDMASVSHSHMDSEVKMLQNFANGVGERATKRMPEHFDLTVPTQPSKRQRKVQQTVQQVPQNFTESTPAVSSAQTQTSCHTGAQTQQRNMSSMTMISDSMGAQMNNAVQNISHSSSNAQMSVANPMSQPSQFAMMPTISQHMTVNQHMENNQSFRGQNTTPQSQDGTDSKSSINKNNTRRKTRVRVKKGKNLLEAPKKPKTAYNYYQIGVRDSILAEIMSEEAKATKEVQSQKVARIIGERWKSMPEQEREAFNTLALQDKQRYKRELGEYVQLKAQLRQAYKGMNPIFVHNQRMQENPMMMNGNGNMNNNMGVNYGLANGTVMNMGGSHLA